MCMIGVLLSCEHKKLEFYGEDAAEVDVRFQWPDTVLAPPPNMWLLAFSVGGPVQDEFNFGNPYGGGVLLTGGTYQFLCYNANTESLLSRGYSWQNFEIYAIPTQFTRHSPMFVTTRNIPMAPQTEEMPVVSEPDELWTAAFSPMVVSRDSNQMAFLMHSATQSLRFVVHNVYNLAYVSDLAATVSGLPAGWHPASNEASATQCVIPFALKGDGDSAIEGSVRCFIHSPATCTASHHLMVYAMLMDGTKWYYDFDVTQQLHEGCDTIELDDLPFPKPITNGSGLAPSMDEWQNVDIEIRMQ